MIKIAICDDVLHDLDETKKLIEKYLDSHLDIAGIIYTFSHPYEMLDEAQKNGGFSIYILDVIMPKINGIELGKELRKSGDEGEIIYLTTSCDYAIDSYDAGAFFYLVKPVSEGKMFKIVDKAIKSLKSKSSEGITVNTPNGLIRINFDEILYVEQLDRMLHYHLVGGKIVSSCVIRKSFSSEIEPLLSDKRFFPCGSSYVLNLHRIKNINLNMAIFSDLTSLELPKTRKKDIKNSWVEYWIERRKQNEI